MSFIRSISTVVGLVIIPTLAFATTDRAVLQYSDITLNTANNLLNAALAACNAEGRTGVAAVVDRGGNLVALKRNDGVGPHNTLAAQRKAYTALSTRTSTRLLAERARNTPDSENLNTLAELLLLGGGVPLQIKQDVIGAIGIAGTGSAVSDENCALAAIAKVLPTSNQGS